MIRRDNANDARHEVTAMSRLSCVTQNVEWRRKQEIGFPGPRALKPPCRHHNCQNSDCQREGSQHRENKPSALQGEGRKRQQLAAIPFSSSTGSWCWESTHAHAVDEKDLTSIAAKTRNLTGESISNQPSSDKSNVSLKPSSKLRAFSLGSPVP